MRAAILGSGSWGTALAFHNLLGDLGPGEVAAGELAIPQSGSTRLLPAGLCGRWWRGAGAAA